MISSDTKILITGCGGMLGEAVYEEFSSKCNLMATDIDINEPWLSLLDVRKKEDIFNITEGFKPDIIIHLAALTDMELCETDPVNAYKTNTESVQFLSQAAFSANIPFLYISTAGVFDGKKNEYVEEDMPNPLSVYGKSKYYGELVARNIPKSIVIRAGWMMGGGPKKDKKFINKVIKQIKNGRAEILALNDKFGTPCYTYDLAKSMYYLLDTESYGLYHGACEGSASRYDVAKYLLNILGCENKVSVKSVDSKFFEENFEEKYFAPRPRSEKLINTRLEKLNPSLTRDWQVCLEEYINKFNWEI